MMQAPKRETSEATHPALSLVSKEWIASRQDIDKSFEHDLLNLLAVIQGFAQILAQDGLALANQLNETRIKSICVAASQATSLVKAHARADAEQAGEEAETDLRVVLRAAAALVESTKPTGISVKLTLPEVPVLVTIDELQLARALLNTLNNAVQSIDETGSVSISLVSRATTPSWFGLSRHIGTISDMSDWRIEIEDTGSGMTRRELSRAFEARFSTKTASGGSGYGLQSLNDFCNHEKGMIEVTTRRRRGTRVTFRFPSELANADETDCPGMSGAVHSKLKAVQIVILDENPLSGTVLKHALKRRNFCVTHMSSTNEALACDLSPFSLMIIDMKISNVDGNAFAQRIKEQYPDIVLIACSGHRLHQPRENLFDAALHKPLDFDVLSTLAEKLLADRLVCLPVAG